MRVVLFTWTESSTSDHTNLHWRNLTCLDTTIRFSVTQQLTRVRLVLGGTATAALSYRFCSLLLWKEFLGASKRWGVACLWSQDHRLCFLQILLASLSENLQLSWWWFAAKCEMAGMKSLRLWFLKLWRAHSWFGNHLGSQVEKFKYLGSYSWVGGEWSHRLMDELEWWGCCTSLW